MKKLSIAYFGTPYFSARFLEKCLTDSTVNQLTEIKFVVTRPDKPVGRKQILTPSPVKQAAQKFGIQVLEFENLTNENSLKIENLKLRIKNLDMAFLYAYGGIIPNDLLYLPRLGFLNTHPSLLPKYRGASPIAYPLILGENKTGVTLFVMDEKMDHGPIIVQEEMEILPTDKRPDLEIKLTKLAFRLLKRSVLIEDGPHLTPQNHSLATHAHYLTKYDGFIPLSTLKKALKNEPLQLNELPKIILDYINKYNLIGNYKLKTENSAKIIYNYFRGLYPWPGIWTTLPNGKRLKITDVEYKNSQLIVKKVQLEGKKEVNFKTFNNAYKVFTP